MEAPDFTPDDWREWRRLRALQLKQQGWYQRDIAAALGITEVTVSRWRAQVRLGGPGALRTPSATRPRPHRSPPNPPSPYPSRKIFELRCLSRCDDVYCHHYERRGRREAGSARLG